MARKGRLRLRPLRLYEGKCAGEAHRSERIAQCLQSRSCACPRWGRS